MALLDGILGQVTGGDGVGAIAQKLGIDPAIAEKAVAALGASHDEPGDTIAGAAAKSGLDQGTLASVEAMLGGESALGKLAGLMKDNPQAAAMVSGFLDRDGDGNPLNDLAGMAKGLFGKR